MGEEQLYQPGDIVWAEGNIWSRPYIGKVIGYEKGKYNDNDYVINFSVFGRTGRGTRVYSKAIRKATTEEIKEEKKLALVEALK